MALLLATGAQRAGSVPEALLHVAQSEPARRAGVEAPIPGVALWDSGGVKADRYHRIAKFGSAATTPNADQVKTWVHMLGKALVDINPTGPSSMESAGSVTGDGRAHHNFVKKNTLKHAPAPEDLMKKYDAFFDFVGVQDNENERPHMRRAGKAQTGQYTLDQWDKAMRSHIRKGYLSDPGDPNVPAYIADGGGVMGNPKLYSTQGT